MFSMPQTSPADREPTVADLVAIEHEWPLIAAELDVLDAEITLLTTKRPSELDWRRLRRAEARVIRTRVSTRRPAEISGGGVAA